MAKRPFIKYLFAIVLFIAIVVILPSALTPRTLREDGFGTLSAGSEAPSEETSADESVNGYDDLAASNTEMTEDTPFPEEEDTLDEPVMLPGLPSFEPCFVEETDPDRMLASTAIMVDGKIVDSYISPENVDFGFGDAYSWIEGVTTFRGNNFRDTAAYGYAAINNAKFGEKWSIATGDYMAPDGAYWSGHGWTGQPLIVKWPKYTREIMNMYEWAKEQPELTEVIYASMDGNVYFAELETGIATRDKLYLGFPFKGSGAIDPRGYPLLYVGAGYSGPRGAARILIVSLVDGAVLYSFGLGDSFAPRNWTAADAAPLVDTETDKLIYPSENGVLYIISLNSVFEPGAGSMTIAPTEPVKWRYTGRRSQTGGKYWLGIESSPAIWRGFIFLTDNGGHLICLNLNTLEPVWVQDVYDDTNCTPVLELEDGHPYIYVSTSFHPGWRAPENSSATVPIWKIDAESGETIWMTIYTCYTASGVSGGVQATAALGKNSLEGLVYIPFARTPSRSSGILAALDKMTGEVIWEFQTTVYSWSSPVCVYDRDGNGYVIYCTAGGYMYLLDGLTGELLDSVLLGGVIEASPAVYNNIAVVGTRAMKIWGVELA